METRSWIILPGTRCQLSRAGGPLEPYVVPEPLQFTTAEERDDGLLIFHRGTWVILSPRKGVVISHYGSGHGWNEWLQ